MENRPRMRKGPGFPRLGREISPFCPSDIGTPSLHLSDVQFAAPIPNILNKIEENCTFALILHCSLHFWALPPQIYGLSSLFYYIILSDLVLT